MLRRDGGGRRWQFSFVHDLALRGLQARGYHGSSLTSSVQPEQEGGGFFTFLLRPPRRAFYKTTWFNWKNADSIRVQTSWALVELNCESYWIGTQDCRKGYNGRQAPQDGGMLPDYFPTLV